MVIGGQAVLLHGQPRATLDIDITLGVDVSEAFGRVLDAAGTIGLDPIPPEDPEAFARKTMVLPAKEPVTAESGSISSSLSCRTNVRRSGGRRWSPSMVLPVRYLRRRSLSSTKCSPVVRGTSRMFGAS